jgi:hypothetical protein
MHFMWNCRRAVVGVGIIVPVVEGRDEGWAEVGWEVVAGEERRIR